MPRQVSFAAFTLAVDRTSAPDAITISPVGALRYSACSRIQRTIQTARNIGKRVFIDLSEVTLVERKALAFLGIQKREGVALIGARSTL